MNYKELRNVLKQDYARYEIQPFGRRTFWGYLLGLRIANYLSNKRKESLVFAPPYVISAFVCKIASHVYQIQIPITTSIGGGLKFAHFSGIVIANSVVIGENCTIHQNVTLGNGFSKNNSGHPVIGDNVVIFPGAVVAGNVKVGNHVLITANAVVTKDVPNNSIVGGVPAKIIGVYNDETLSKFAKELYEVQV